LLVDIVYIILFFKSISIFFPPFEKGGAKTLLFGYTFSKGIVETSWSQKHYYFGYTFSKPNIIFFINFSLTKKMGHIGPIFKFIMYFFKLN